MFTVEFIQTPTEGLAEEAAQVFAEVMKEDPLAVCLTGGSPTAGDPPFIKRLGLTLLRALLLTPEVSHMYTARDPATGMLAGFTVFSLPGQLMLSTEEQQENAKVLDYMRDLSQEGKDFFANTMEKLIPKANDMAFGIEAAERNTYWCNFAMVRSEYQHKGTAKQMFALAFKEADKLGKPVALTTTNYVNVEIYERIGFKQCGEMVQFKQQSPEWSLWFFKREPSGCESAPSTGDGPEVTPQSESEGV